jgi:hypothetical protein
MGGTTSDEISEAIRADSIVRWGPMRSGDDFVHEIVPSLRQSIVGGRRISRITACMRGEVCSMTSLVAHWRPSLEPFSFLGPQNRSLGRSRRGAEVPVMVDRVVRIIVGDIEAVGRVL